MEGSSCEVLTICEISYLKEFIKVTYIFSNAISNLEKEESQYFSYILPTLLTITKHLKSLCNNTLIYMGTPLIEIIKRVNNLIDNYYLVDGNISNAMITTSLYPFFKLNWVPDNMDAQFHLQIRKKCIVTLYSLISQETTLPEADSRDSYIKKSWGNK